MANRVSPNNVMTQPQQKPSTPWPIIDGISQAMVSHSKALASEENMVICSIRIRCSHLQLLWSLRTLRSLPTMSGEGGSSLLWTETGIGMHQQLGTTQMHQTVHILGSLSQPMIHCKFTNFFPLGLSLLQLLLLCSLGVLWPEQLMSPLGCKGYTISIPQSYQRPRFPKYKGSESHYIRPNLNIVQLILLS